MYVISVFYLNFYYGMLKGINYRTRRHEDDTFNEVETVALV